MNKLQSEVYTWKLLLKDKTTINITEAQYNEIIPTWAKKEYRNIYLKSQERWLDSFDIKYPINIEQEKKKREAAYFQPEEDEDESEEDRQERVENLKRVRVLKKYIYEGADRLSESEKEIVKEHYKAVAIGVKEKLKQTYTKESKETLEERLEECKTHWKILTK